MRQTIHMLGFFLIILRTLTACVSAPPTAAELVVGPATANPALAATVQADQYQRDAQATLDRQAVTREALALSIEQTAVAATATINSANTQATATAHSQQTADALAFAQTRAAATIEAEHTRTAATVQAQQTQYAYAIQSAQATNTAVSAATQAAFAATRQAHELAQAQAAANREQVVTAVTATLAILAVLAGIVLLIVFFWKVIPTLVNRFGVVRYGQHGNPLLISERNGRIAVTNPLQMLQAGMTVEEDGRLTMPELTPNDLQTLVAGGYLQMLMEQVRHALGHRPLLPSEETVYRRVGGIETERMTKHQLSERVQKRPFEPSSNVNNNHANTASNSHRPAIELLSALDREQAILIHGAKGTGKTTLLKHLMARRQHCLILDPHGAPDKWPNCLMIGAGRDYEAIGLALAGLIALMNHRYTEIGQGAVREGEHEKMTLLIDEYRGIVQNVPKSGKVITALLTEARKAQIDMVLVSHSKLVKALGMQGEGDLREGFALVHLLEAHGRRAATLNVGQGPMPVRLPGPFQGVGRMEQVVKSTPPAWLLQAIQAPDQGQLGQGVRSQLPFTAPSVDTAVLDAERLLTQEDATTYFTSRRSVAVFLTNGLDNKYAYDRAKSALQLLSERGIAWAIHLHDAK